MFMIFNKSMQRMVCCGNGPITRYMIRAIQMSVNDIATTIKNFIAFHYIVSFIFHLSTCLHVDLVCLNCLLRNWESTRHAGKPTYTKSKYLNTETKVSTNLIVQVNRILVVMSHQDQDLSKRQHNPPPKYKGQCIDGQRVTNTSIIHTCYCY